MSRKIVVVLSFAILAFCVVSCGQASGAGGLNGGSGGGGGSTLSITTSGVSSATLNVAYSQAITAAGGSGQGYSWAVTTGSLPVGLTLTASGTPNTTLSGTPTVISTSIFTVTVTDSQGQQAFKLFNMSVAKPSPSIITVTLPDARQNTPYTHSIVASGGSGTGYIWSVTVGVLPAGLSLTPTGTPLATLQGTPTVPGPNIFTITVTDSGNQTGAHIFSLTVTPELKITTTVLPSGTEGTPYSQNVDGTGGSGSYAWVITAGALPAGLTLASSGTPTTTISGTPTTGGATFTFTVQVTDFSSFTATKQLQITLAALPALTISPSSMQGWTKDLAGFTEPITGAGGTGTGYTWTQPIGTMPPGWVIGATGTPSTTITGTPTAAGHYDFTIRLSDDQSPTPHTKDQAYSVDILPAGSLTITTNTLPDDTNGTPYNQNLTAVGGSGAGLTWKISVSTLPTGLSMGGNNTVLSWGSFSQTGLIDQSLGGGKLTEVSGIAASKKNAGIYWVHDDSGAGPSFYAIDATGTVKQEYQLTITATDWEDIAVGPGPDPTKEYIYIADVGDNSTNRSDCHIIRVEAPTVPGSPGAPVNLPFDAFYFTYPGGAQNCETLLFDWETGTPYLVEKVGTGTPRVHKFPVPLQLTWTSGAPVTLTSVTATGTFDATLTGGDGSRDARRIFLRGYDSGREYVRAAGATFDSIFTTAGTVVTVPGAQKYEAICYSADGTKLFTTTETLPPGTLTAPIKSATATTVPMTTTITGTPTSPGVYVFTVQVTDSAGNTATRKFTVAIT